VLARILVVEDEVDTRMVLGKFLTVAGHEVIPAANGWEALLVLDTTGVDLILLDVMMPGMDGVTFLQILRQAKKHKDMPVVLVTALEIVMLALGEIAVMNEPAGMPVPLIGMPTVSPVVVVVVMTLLVAVSVLVALATL
jgi:CheY-like chemotaxis protein